jgi:hypothetical protein
MRTKVNIVGIGMVEQTAIKNKLVKIHLIFEFLKFNLI